MSERPQLFWGMVASMWIGNLMLLRHQPAADRDLGATAQGPLRFLYLSILLFCAIGVYTIGNSPFSCWSQRFSASRLHFHAARMRAGADDPRLVLGPADGGQSAPRDANLKRRHR